MKISRRKTGATDSGVIGTARAGSVCQRDTDGDRAASVPPEEATGTCGGGGGGVVLVTSVKHRQGEGGGVVSSRWVVAKS